MSHNIHSASSPHTYHISLALAYPEHLSATYRTYTLSCRLTILHGYGFSVLHFPFSTAFHTVCLHRVTSLFCLV